jgi:hypothetical protein
MAHAALQTAEALRQRTDAGPQHPAPPHRHQQGGPTAVHDVRVTRPLRGCAQDDGGTSASSRGAAGRGYRERVERMRSISGRTTGGEQGAYQQSRRMCRRGSNLDGGDTPGIWAAGVSTAR